METYEVALALLSSLPFATPDSPGPGAASSEEELLVWAFVGWEECPGSTGS